MPSQVRNNKYVWLLSKRENDIQVPVGVAGTFRSAYKVLLFESKISKPNLTERQARQKYKKTGECWLWNKDEFETFEEAMWSPIGRIAKLEKIPILRS